MYVNGFITFSKKAEKHLQHIKKKIRLLPNAVMTIKLKKRLFFSKTIDFLRHEIDRWKAQLTQKAKEAIKLLQYTTTVSKLWSFHGLCNVNCKSVLNGFRQPPPPDERWAQKHKQSKGQTSTS